MESRPISSNNRINVAIGALLVLFGVLALVETIVPTLGEMFWMAAFAVGGVVMLAVYLTDRTQWWPLIPAYILFTIAAIIFTATFNVFQANAMGAFIMFAFALPFLFVALRDRRHWWAFIPAYVFGVIGAIITLEGTVLNGDAMGAFVMFAFALPFLVIGLSNSRNWWALIPAYVFASIGVMLAFVVNRGDEGKIVPAYVMFAVAAPFLFVFVRNPRNWWALIPGGIMASIGLGFMMSITSVQYIVPAALIVGGLLLIGRQFVRRPAEPVASPSERDVAPELEPVSGPEADRPRG
jgi:hypothetical protein